MEPSQKYQQSSELDYGAVEINLICAKFISSMREQKVIQQIPQMIYMNVLQKRFSQTDFLFSKIYVAITPPISLKEQIDIIFAPTGDSLHSLRSNLDQISKDAMAKLHQPFVPLMNKIMLENHIEEYAKLKEFLNSLDGNDVIREALIILNKEKEAVIRISIPILLQDKWIAYEINIQKGEEKYKLKVIRHPTYEEINEPNDILHTHLIDLLSKNNTCDVVVESSPTKIIRSCFTGCYGILTVQDCLDLFVYGSEFLTIPEKHAVVFIKQHIPYATNFEKELVLKFEKIILTYPCKWNVKTCLKLKKTIEDLYKACKDKLEQGLFTNYPDRLVILNTIEIIDKLLFIPYLDKFYQMLECIKLSIPYVPLIPEDDQIIVLLSSFFDSILNYVKMKQSNETKKSKKLSKLYKKTQNCFDLVCIHGSQLFHFRSNTDKWEMIQECKKRRSGVVKDLSSSDQPDNEQSDHSSHQNDNNEKKIPEQKVWLDELLQHYYKQAVLSKQISQFQKGLQRKINKEHEDLSEESFLALIKESNEVKMLEASLSIGNHSYYELFKMLFECKKQCCSPGTYEFLYCLRYEFPDSAIFENPQYTKSCRILLDDLLDKNN